MRNFTHGESTLPKLVLYQGNGYYSAFCTRVQQQYNDAVAFAFSSAFSILPDGTDDPALVSDDEDDGPLPSHLVEDDAMEWYAPPPQPASTPPITVDHPPIETIPSPLPHRTDGSSFELGMSLSFYDGRGNSEMVVYKGVMPDGLTHTVRRKNGIRLHVHNAHLRLKLQVDLSNIPKTPLDYCKEVGQGISKEEAEALARPRVLTPVQQELMDWHHRLYHLSFPKIFRLAEKGYLPSRLLDCKGKLPLCIACQFGAAHSCPWR